jgi:hypothetical protein
MSPENRLFVAHRNEHFAMFWKYAEEDEADAPLAMQALIDGQGPVPATPEEADEVLAWCQGRIGCMPLPKRPSLRDDVQWPVGGSAPHFLEQPAGNAPPEPAPNGCAS